MEEKKSIKLSLLTIFLIIAIFVIIVMGYFIYKISSEKKSAESRVNELNTQVTTLEEKTNYLQEKINSVQNIVGTTNLNMDSSTNKLKDLTEFSNDEIKKSLQNYLDLIGIKEGSPLGMLVKLGLCNYTDYDNANRTNDNYVKTNIKYLDYKEKMLNYVTEEWFNTNFKNVYKEKDGFLYYFDGGASGMEFEVENITIKGDYSDLVYIAEVYNIHFDDSKELENIEFHIDNNNGKCIISYCDL